MDTEVQPQADFLNEEPGVGRCAAAESRFRYSTPVATNSANRSIQSEGRAIGMLILPLLHGHFPDCRQSLLAAGGAPELAIHGGVGLRADYAPRPGPPPRFRSILTRHEHPKRSRIRALRAVELPLVGLSRSAKLARRKVRMTLPSVGNCFKILDNDPAVRRASSPEEAAKSRCAVRAVKRRVRAP